MVKKIGHIISGWGKRMGLISISKAEDKLSELRMKICKGCDLSKSSKVLKLLNGEAKEGVELKCVVCKCPCFQKTIVTDESCPMGKW